MSLENPFAFAVIVTGVGQAVLDALPTSYGGDVTRKCLLVPGAIAADGCDCGQFAQTILRDNPSDVFPVDSSLSPVSTRCGPRSLMCNVMAIIFRCVPGITMSNGVARYPTCAALLNAGLVQESDAWVLRRAITCRLQAFKDARQIDAFYVGGTERSGPEGNCGGPAITYGFQLVA